MEREEGRGGERGREGYKESGRERKVGVEREEGRGTRRVGERGR